MFYRLKEKTGRHVQGGREYKAGDIIETEMDLVKSFTGKFEVVHDEYAEDNGIKAPVIKIPSTEGDADTGKKKAKKKTDKKADKEVTKDYPTALDIGVKVFKKSKSNGDWFYIIDPDDTDEQMNDKMLREKNVVKFIASITED